MYGGPSGNCGVYGAILVLPGHGRKTGLVDFAARLPSNLKLRGLSGTKYIYRKILEGTLPNKILYERPKMGHTVPMKNWMREHEWLKQCVPDLLFDGTLR